METNLNKEFLFNFYDAQANNINIILSQCIESGNFSFLYEYLSSEIELRGGLKKFCLKTFINIDEINKFLQSKDEPSLILLIEILNGLGYQLSAIPNKIK